MLNPQLADHLEAFGERGGREGEEGDGGGSGRRGGREEAEAEPAERRGRPSLLRPAFAAALAVLAAVAPVARCLAGLRAAAPWERQLLEGIRSSAGGAPLAVPLLLSAPILLAFLLASSLGRAAMVQLANSLAGPEERLPGTSEDPEARRRDDDDDAAGDAPCDPVMACRRDLSKLLGSVGAPPLTPLEPAAEASAGRARLAAVEALARHHAALVGRVDDLLEWIRDAAALRLFRPGGGSAPPGSDPRGAARFSPSVELAERSAAARLLGERKGNDEGTAAPRVPAPRDGSSERPRSLARAAGSLPLARIRRNVALVMMRQIQALSACARDDEGNEGEAGRDPASGGADGDAPRRGAEGDDPRLPAVITLSWLRSLRDDLTRALSCVVDASCKCSGTPSPSGLGGKAGNALAGKSNSASRDAAVVFDDLPLSAMHRATALAREALAYLESYPQGAAHDATSKTATDADRHCDELLRALQPQSLALITASLALNESLCSPPRDRGELLAGHEFHLWWTTLRDLSRRLSNDVESLGAALRLPKRRHRSPSPLHGGDDGNDREGDSQRQHRSTKGDDGHVLVSQSDELELRVPGDRSRDRELSSTLVYSGQGSAARNVAPSRRGGAPTCSAQIPAAHHAASVDLYQSLIQELQGRLGMVLQEEVDATSRDSTAPMPGHAKQNWDDSGSDRTSPLGRMSASGNKGLLEPNTGVKPFSAALLSELRGALVATLSSDTDGAESFDEAANFSGVNSEG
jgi:hypothetical protein